MTRSSRRPAPPSRWRRALAHALVLWIAAVPASRAPHAAPSGPDVVAGNAGVVQSGKDTTVIAGDRAILEWDSFDIGAGESVTFVQPGAWARVLNRVPAGGPTQIDGRLSANGRVYLVNPYGIYFGGSAIVDTAGLVAAAGNLSNADFLAGIDRFDGLGGRVENRGEIRADAVALLGRSVANHGLVSAPDGAIWMAAGDEVWIGQHGSPLFVRVETPRDAAQGYAVENHGTLDAGRGSVRLSAGDLLSLAIHNRGTIRAREIALRGGEGGRVQVGGTLDASDAKGTGGHVEVRGTAIVVEGAEVDASGEDGGGSIHVGAGPQGAGDGTDARLVHVDAASTLRADATKDGDGGEVVVYADGAAVVQGSLSARGGQEGGDGGFVETSGRRYIEVGAAPDLAAPEGRAGHWLIDPSNLEIVSALSVSGAQDLTPFLADIDQAPDSGTPLLLPTADASQVLASTLVDALARGFDVTLSTENDGAPRQNEPGNIVVSGALDFSAASVAPGTQATLGLRAANRVQIDAAIDGNDAAGNLELSLDFDAGDRAQPAPGPDISVSALNDAQNVEVNAAITTRGDVSLRGASVDVAADVDAGSFSATAFEGGITTQSITTRDGGVDLVATRQIDPDPDDGVTPPDLRHADISVSGAIDTDGSNVFVSANGGDVAVSGDIDAVLVSGSAGGSVAVGATRLGAQGAPDDADDLAGGTLVLSGALRAGENGTGLDGTPVSAVTISSTESTTIDGSIDTLGGDVLVDLSKAIAINGAVTTDGGDLNTAGALGEGGGSVSTLALSADVDTRATSDPTQDDGSVLMRHEGDITLADGVSVRAESIDLQAGAAGNGTLRFGASTLAATDVALQAGDGFSFDLAPGVDPGTLSAIDFGTLAIDTTDLASLAIRQDADLASADVPLPAAGALGGLDVELAANDGRLEVTLGDAARLAGSRLVLEARGDATAPATAFDLQEALAVESLDLRTSETLQVDTTLAGRVSGNDTLRIEAGRGGRAASGTAPEVQGDLRIADGAVLQANDALELHGASNGFGDLVFEGAATVSADVVTLRAGDGTGGVTGVSVAGAPPVPAARIQNAAGISVNPGSRFTFRQDADINNGRDAPDTVNGIVYELRSDDSRVDISDATRVDDTDLVLLAASGIGIADPVTVRSADLGGIGSFTVDQPLLDAISFADPNTSKLVLRAAAGTDGTLAFSGNPALRANEVRLIASDGRAGNLAAAVDLPTCVALPACVTFTRIDDPATPALDESTLAPSLFVYEQDAGVAATDLPRDIQFGDGSGSALPDTFAIRSLDGGFAFDPLPQLAGSKLLLSGPVIDLGSSDGSDLRFTVPTELRGDTITLRAQVASGTPQASGPRVDTANLVSVAQADEAIELDPAAPPGAPPATFSIVQDADVVSGFLPDASIFEDGMAAGIGAPADADAMLYELRSRAGSILLSDPTKHEGTNLVLRLDDEASADLDQGGRTIDINTSGAALTWNLHDLDAATEAPITFGAPTTVDAVEDISILSGLDGTGDLGFLAPTTLRARRIVLAAGESENLPIAIDGVEIDPATFSFARVDTTNLSLELEAGSDEALLQILQDADLVAPASAPTVLNPVNDVTAIFTSLRGTVDVPDASVLGFAQNVQLSAGAFDASTPHGVSVTRTDGLDLDFSGFDLFQIDAQQATLRAEAGGRVLANDPDLQFTTPDPGGALALTLRQGVAWVTDASAPGGAQFAQASQFKRSISGTGSGSLTGVDYTLIAPGPLAVDTALATQIGGADLRIESRDLADVLGGGITVALGTSDPLFGDFAIEATGVTLDTDGFETRGVQSYEAPVTLARDVALEGDGMLFEDGVDAATAGMQSLSLTSRGETRLARGVGGSAALADLSVDFDAAGATLELGSDGDAGPTALRLAGDLSIDSDAASTGTDSDPRSPVPSLATVFERDGDLAIQAANVYLGSGEKLTVRGTLDIDAPGGAVQVGDLSADRIEIAADSLAVQRRPAGTVRTAGGGFEPDGGVDIVANSFDLDIGASGDEPIGVLGRGRNPVFGVPDGRTRPVEAAAFSSAAITPRRTPLDLASLVDTDAAGNALVLDARPRGPAGSDLSTSLPGPVPAPVAGKAAPLADAPVERDAFAHTGIAARPPRPDEQRGRLRDAAIFDDASRAWQRGDAPLDVAAARIDPALAAEAERLFVQVLGPDFSRAERIREVLRRAVEDYQRQTGARRVLGFELRRFLKNRPSTEFEAYQALEDLDRLFSAHRRTGLAPAEYGPIQRRWVERITPPGIEPDELAEAIQPSRYVRGSDILDIFGR